jgi:hypothetical protein
LLNLPVAGLSNQRISLVSGLVLAAIYQCRFAVLPLVVKYTLNGQNPSSLSLYHPSNSTTSNANGDDAGLRQGGGLQRLSELLPFDTYFDGDALVTYADTQRLFSGLRIVRSLPPQVPSQRVAMQPWPKTLAEAERVTITAPIIEMPVVAPIGVDWVVDWRVDWRSSHGARVGSMLHAMFMAVSLSRHLLPTAVSLA